MTAADWPRPSRQFHEHVRANDLRTHRAKMIALPEPDTPRLRRIPSIGTRTR